MIFTKRYKELIYNENGQFDDRLTGEIDYYVKKRIVEVMNMFDEPLEIKPSRYSDKKVRCGALICSIETFNHEKGYDFFHIYGPSFDDTTLSQLAGGFTPYLFDVIEYQWDYLSDGEKSEFSKEINDTFSEFDIPWVLLDGKMIKIDSAQFEMDLKNKAEALMLELKDAEPEFQAAYDELNKSIEFYNKGDYSEAILNADKSYESVMKVFLNVAKGNADKLTEDISERIELPESIKNDGFKEKVLMSLPYIRNNASSHGAGAKEIIVSKELANLSINLSCSLITYLIGEYKKNGGE